TGVAVGTERSGPRHLERWLPHADDRLSDHLGRRGFIRLGLILPSFILLAGGRSLRLRSGRRGWCEHAGGEVGRSTNELRLPRVRGRWRLGRPRPPKVPPRQQAASRRRHRGGRQRRPPPRSAKPHRGHSPVATVTYRMAITYLVSFIPICRD